MGAEDRGVDRELEDTRDRDTFLLPEEEDDSEMDITDGANEGTFGRGFSFVREEFPRRLRDQPSVPTPISRSSRSKFFSNSRSHRLYPTIRPFLLWVLSRSTWALLTVFALCMSTVFRTSMSKLSSASSRRLWFCLLFQDLIRSGRSSRSGIHVVFDPSDRFQVLHATSYLPKGYLVENVLEGISQPWCTYLISPAVLTSSPIMPLTGHSPSSPSSPQSSAEVVESRHISWSDILLGLCRCPLKGTKTKAPPFGPPLDLKN